MPNDPRIIDHEPVIAAARADASREGARLVFMTVGELWRMIHRAPDLSAAEREQLAANLQPR